MDGILAQASGHFLSAQDVLIEGERAAGNAAGLLMVAGFVLLLFILNRVLRRRERRGEFDAGPSSAARPGLRTFFDYGDDGFGKDGNRQGPAQK
jgi:hypothetical protein